MTPEHGSSLSVSETRFVQDLVIYQDSALLVFNKPSGLAVQTRGNRGVCLENYLHVFAKSNGKLPRLVHRLDAGTSGLLLAARTKPMAAHLSGLFSKRLVKKTYLALVEGDLPSAKSAQITQGLIHSSGERALPPMIPSNNKAALSAITHWKVRAREGKYALMELRPKTGRMHQLRAHMAYLGCPIIGDRIYGQKDSKAERLMLHATALRFTLPDNMTEAKFHAPLPPNMANYLSGLHLCAPDEASL